MAVGWGTRLEAYVTLSLLTGLRAEEGPVLGRAARAGAAAAGGGRPDAVARR
jgi:hypothetical protein